MRIIRSLLRLALQRRGTHHRQQPSLEAPCQLCHLTCSGLLPRKPSLSKPLGPTHSIQFINKLNISSHCRIGHKAEHLNTRKRRHSQPRQPKNERSTFMHQTDQHQPFPRMRRPPIRQPTTLLTVLIKSNETQRRHRSAIRTMTMHASPAFGRRAPLHWMCGSLIPIQALWSAGPPFLNLPLAILSSHHLPPDRAYSSLPLLRSRTPRLITRQKQ